MIMHKEHEWEALAQQVSKTLQNKGKTRLWKPKNNLEKIPKSFDFWYFLQYNIRVVKRNLKEEYVHV